MSHIIVLEEQISLLNDVRTYSEALASNMSSYHGQQLAAAQQAESDLASLASELKSDYNSRFGDIKTAQESALGI